MLFKKNLTVTNVLFYGLQSWHFSLFAIYLLCVLQRLEKWEYSDSVQKVKEYRNFIFYLNLI